MGERAYINYLQDIIGKLLEELYDKIHDIL